VIEFAEWLGATPLSVAIQSRLWLTPLLQTIHITMIGIVFVSMLNVALRVLGKIRADEPLAEVWHRFSPWFWCALGVMAGTGLVLAIGEPVRQVTALSFWIKMSLLAIGVASALYFGRTVAAAASGSDPTASGGARFVAVATIVLWVAIVFLGRWIAYDVEIWESWHLA
jgi:putative copper export protein